MPSIKIKVDVVEALGAETLLYCKTDIDAVVNAEGSIDDDVSNLIAKVDSRSTTKAGEIVEIAIDIDHCHIFDKETELTILARNEENKAELIELQAKRAEEEAKKAAEEAAKLAAQEEAARIKLEKKLAKKSK